MKGWNKASASHPCRNCGLKRARCLWKIDQPTGAELTLCYRWEEHGVAPGLEVMRVFDRQARQWVPRAAVESAAGLGQVFVPAGFRPAAEDAAADVNREALARRLKAEKEAREAEEERRRGESVEYARALWRKAKGGEEGVLGTAPGYLDGAGVDHPRVRAYLLARGIRAERLPAGKVPPTVRYLGACSRVVEVEEQAGLDEAGKPRVCVVKRREELPAVVCAATTAEKRVVAVQRIYLDPSGAAAKAPGPPEQAKKAVGSLSMAQAVRLSLPDKRGGVLILTEGVETGLGVLAACGRADGTWPTVWSVVSTAGLKNFRLTDADALPEAGGWVRHLIIAADLDRPGRTGKRPGSEAARALYVRLAGEWPGVSVTVAHPTHAAAPDLVTPDGLPAGEDGQGPTAVDWLDVLSKHGPDPVRKALLPADDAEPKSREKILPPQRSERAKLVLRDLFAPPWPRAKMAWQLRRFAGAWWVYRRGARPRWVREQGDEALISRVSLLCDDFKVATERGLKPAALSGRAVEDVMKAAIVYTHVAAEAMPTMLPPDFDDAGKPTWGTAVRFDRPEAAEAEVGGGGRELIAYADGLLDVEAFVDGQVRVVPHSPRWFSRSCLPFRVPVRELAEVDEAAGPDADGTAFDAAAAAMAAKRCPAWMTFLKRTLEGDAASIDELQKWFGYALCGHARYQKILWLQGVPGSGKGTIREVMTAMVGEDNVAMTDFDALGERFSIAPMIGKNLIVLPELHVGVRGDAARALGRLKSFTGGDPVPVEEKFEAVQPLVRITGKVVVTPNEEPTLPDSSAALLRRLLVIPTGPPVPESDVDPLLARKLSAEAAAIMAWSLCGLRRLEREGGFRQPARGVEIREEMRRSMSPIAAFIEDRCVLQAGSSVSVEVLYAQWKAWCEDNARHGGSRERLGAGLRAAAHGITRRGFRGEGRRSYEYVGIRLRFPGEDPAAPMAPCAVREWPVAAWALAAARPDPDVTTDSPDERAPF